MKGRVRVAKDKAGFIRSLKNSANPNSPFQTYADIVTFAAVIGAKRRKREPLEGISLKEPDPIPQEQFFTRGHEPVINLLAITATADPKALASTEEYEDLRLRVFEEYANAGFRILQNELFGVENYTKQILLILHRTKLVQEDEDISFNMFFN